ncbi:UNVERIFIED_CONTAM: hypothetical protein Slati_4498800 [Sesamum latifolium]|uniref:Uncharacterized protein n=1 Tax=Sesamum latifolium TaxID=2727402 RepID=A0AAW2SUU8_9LAMI
MSSSFPNRWPPSASGFAPPPPALHLHLHLCGVAGRRHRVVAAQIRAQRASRRPDLGGSERRRSPRFGGDGDVAPSSRCRRRHLHLFICVRGNM